LRALEKPAGKPPFPVDDALCRNAFLCGAVGPDMGYCPGGVPFLSDLAHYVHTAELARNLLRFARNPPQRAFAWGWVSHILADVLGHPLINHASAERLFGDRTLSVSYADDPITHLLVELGLDAFWSVRDPRAGRPALRPVWAPGGAAPFAAAYEATYSVRFAPGPLLASHHASLRATRWVLLLDHVTGSRWADRARGLKGRLFEWFALAPVRWYTARFARASRVHALTRLIPPAPWLVDAFAEVLREVPARLVGMTGDGLERLMDYNLDLGLVESGPSRYEPTRRAMLRLDRRRRPDAA